MYVAVPPAHARFIGEGPAPHHFTTAGKADRPVAGLSAGGRRTKHPEVVGRKGGKVVFKVTPI